MCILKEHISEENFEICEKCYFRTLGAMFDGSQANSLMNIASCKKMMLNSESLIGYSNDKQIMQINDEYYSLGHFSKFIKPGSTRVASYSQNKDLNVVTALEETTGKIVLIVTNNGDVDQTVTIKGLSNAQIADLYRSSENEKLQNVGTVNIVNGEAQLLIKAKLITTVVEK